MQLTDNKSQTKFPENLYIETKETKFPFQRTMQAGDFSVNYDARQVLIREKLEKENADNNEQLHSRFYLTEMNSTGFTPKLLVLNIQGKV